jgi:hypothetical protein
MGSVDFARVEIFPNFFQLLKINSDDVKKPFEAHQAAAVFLE